MLVLVVLVARATLAALVLLYPSLHAKPAPLPACQGAKLRCSQVAPDPHRPTFVPLALAPARHHGRAVAAQPRGPLHMACRVAGLTVWLHHS